MYKGIRDVEGALQDRRGFLPSPQIDSLVFAENLAFADERQNKIHHATVLSAQGCGLQYAHRFLRRPERLFQIALTPKHISRNPKESAGISHALEDMRQIDALLAKQ